MTREQRSLRQALERLQAWLDAYDARARLERMRSTVLYSHVKLMRQEAERMRKELARMACH